ncbi:MAG TPA: DsrE family protein [Sulfuricurvum sp.]|nr:DsrE family protein [Sulfuricurvum sp.]
MKKWLLVLSLSMLLNAEEGLKKVVFDLKTGDTAVFEKTILSGIAVHKAHYEGKLQELDVAVVIHGDAYKFFVKNLAASPYKNEKALIDAHDVLAKRISSAVENYQVHFIMCEATMKKLNIDQKNVYDFVTLTPNSTIGLIDKQNEGYAYIPVR